MKNSHIKRLLNDLEVTIVTKKPQIVSPSPVLRVRASVTQNGTEQLLAE